jgi:hypothetical protein
LASLLWLRWADAASAGAYGNPTELNLPVAMSLGNVDNGF